MVPAKWSLHSNLERRDLYSDCASCAAAGVNTLECALNRAVAERTAASAGPAVADRVRPAKGRALNTVSV